MEHCVNTLNILLVDKNFGSAIEIPMISRNRTNMMPYFCKRAIVFCFRSVLAAAVLSGFTALFVSDAIDEYVTEFGKDYTSRSFTEGSKRRLENAVKSIMGKRDEFMFKNNITFSLLVMHVVQPMHISFHIGHMEKLGMLDNTEDKNMFILYDYRKYFISMMAGIEEIKNVVLKGKDIIRDLNY